MRSRLSSSAPFAALLALAVLAPLPPVLALDRGVSRLLFTLPRPLLAALNLVWIAGALSLTAALLLAVTLARPMAFARRLRIWGSFAGLGLCELALKWIVPTPQPHGPALSTPLLHAVSGLVNVHAGFLHLAGTFPSGHVARLTFLAGAWSGRRGAAWTGALAALAVVSTGGHWLWDALGGLALALAWLGVAGWRRAGGAEPGGRGRSLP